MNSSVDKSLLLQFETDPLARRLDHLRHSVREEFGGGSALALPVHVTLFKWRSVSPDPLLPEVLSEVSAELSVQLGQLMLNIQHRAIWYRVNSKELPDLLRWAKAMLSARSISRLRTPMCPHLTVAYRDYRPETLKRIYQKILNTDTLVHGVLQSSGIALAETDAKGIWHLQKID